MNSFLSRYRYHLYILTAGFVFSGLTLFSALLTRQGVDPFNQVFWRLVFGAIFCFVLAKFFFRQNFNLDRNKINLILINSLWFLFGYITFSGAVYTGAPLAKIVALNYAYPLTVVVFSYLIFKNLPSKRNWLAIIISTLSIPILLEIWKVKNVSQIGLGEFLAWLNSFAYGGIIVWGTKIRKESDLKPFASLFYTLIFSIPILVLIVWLSNQLGVNFMTLNIRVLNLKLENWVSLIGLTLSSSVIPLALVYYGAEKIKPQVTSILLTTEALWVYFLGLFMFGQNLSIWGILGALGILLSVILV